MLEEEVVDTSAPADARRDNEAGREPGQTADARTANARRDNEAGREPGQTADAQTADARTPDARTADARTADARTADARKGREARRGFGGEDGRQTKGESTGGSCREARRDLDGEEGSDQFLTLQAALGAELPSTLRTLTPEELRDLSAALNEARHRQAAELRAAGEQAFSHLPRLLRGPIRKLTVQ